MFFLGFICWTEEQIPCCYRTVGESNSAEILLKIYGQFYLGTKPSTFTNMAITQCYY